MLPGVAASLPFTLSDPDGNTMTLATTGLPRGMLANAVSKVVIGAPLVAGTFNVTMVATDKYGAKSGVGTFTITVPDLPPVIGTQVASRTSVIGTAQSLVLDVADRGTDQDASVNGRHPRSVAGDGLHGCPQWRGARNGVPFLASTPPRFVEWHR